MGPLRVIETAVIVVGGVNGLNVGAEKAWDYAGEHKLGRMFVVNQMDREHANFEKVTAELREKYDLHMRVERFISDENGVPDKDQAFIRK